MPPVGTASHRSRLVTAEAWATMLPQLGPWVSGVESPRKESAPCTSTAVAAKRNTCTKIGPASRGRMCRHMIRGAVSPESRAART